MSALKIVHCPHCNARLRLTGKDGLSGKKLRCPKCKKAILLKARLTSEKRERSSEKQGPKKDKQSSPHQSSPETQTNINELSETDSQVPATTDSKQQPISSSDVLLKGLSGELAPFDELSIEKQRPGHARDQEDDDEDGGTYRLRTESQASSASSNSFEFEEEDEDDEAWASSIGRAADDSATETDTVVETTRDELDLTEALEGLAEQVRSKPTRRKKTMKRSTKKKRRRP